jgi:nucleotide-binding universal stress UspA family protein
MKKILVPIDFSETSDNAFIHALEMANVLNGELILLHTFDLPIVDNQFFPENYIDLYNTVELSEFEHFKDKIPALRTIAEQRNLGKIKLSHMLLEGDLIYNIKNAVKKESIDFVVMGTNGATGWKEFFIGTNTGSVITDIAVPVLSVPVEAKYQKIDNICFTTRFRDKDKDALRIVLNIAKKVNAHVKCLYVKTYYSDVTEMTYTEWKEIFTNEPVQFFVIPSENVKQTIQDFIIEQGIDVLSMLTYKRGFFEDLFSQSLTQKLSYKLTTPILAFHE